MALARACVTCDDLKPLLVKGIVLKPVLLPQRLDLSLQLRVDDILLALEVLKLGDSRAEIGWERVNERGRRCRLIRRLCIGVFSDVSLCREELHGGIPATVRAATPLIRADPVS